MSLVGKNRKLFSYNNDDRSNRTYEYKDFEKTKSYNTSFANSKFVGVSFRAAQIKYCVFDSAEFRGSDFVGTNLRGSSFIGARFIDCIFNATNLDRVNFSNSVFQNCYFIGISINSAKGLSLSSEGVTVLHTVPEQGTVSSELKMVLEELRENDIIRRSKTLHCKKGRINTVTIMLLKTQYTDEQLVVLFQKLPELLTTQFYTISYLKMLLKRAEKIVKI